MEGKTIFDLSTSIDQLPGINDPMSRMSYQQVAPTRDVTKANFPNGQIHFRFETSGTKRWIPNKSYIRMRCSLTQGTAGTDGAQLAVADQVAPNMGLMSNLFQSGEFRIADKTVSRTSDYMAQIDALQTRMDKSKSWVDSQGEATNFWQADIKKRIEEVSSDGKLIATGGSVADVPTGRVAMTFDAVGGAADTTNRWGYTAATGALAYDKGATNTGLTAALASAQFPIGSYFKYLGVAATPEVEMKVLANDGAGALVVEPLLNADVALDSRNDFARVVKSPGGVASRRVKDFELIWNPSVLSIFKVQEALPSMKAELILSPQTAASYKLRAIECLTAKTAGLNYNFSVTDMYLYVATVESTRVDDMTYYLNLDETRCQVDTGSGSGLQQKNFDVSASSMGLTACFQDDAAGSNSLYSASKFKIRADAEQKLERLFLTYDGQSKPSPDADPSFVVGQDRTTQRYADSLLQAGQYFREGGAESLSEWQARGSYYYFAWPKDGRSRSTRAQVNFSLGGTTVLNTRVLLFDHYKSVAHISVKSGRVVDVQLLEG